MNAQIHFRLHHNQSITTRYLRSHNKPSLYSMFSSHNSWLAWSSHNEITFTGLSATLVLPESVAPVASSKQEVVTGAGVGEEQEEKEAEIINAEEWEKLEYEVYEEGRGNKLCGERKGIVEMIECLEEAILGSDQGREPIDYKRRARIFDRSSRVFQALKQRCCVQSP